MTADFLPPRQTGLADFPHPAFAGRYCARLSQLNESHFFQVGVNARAFGGFPPSLATAAQVPGQSLQHEAVDLAHCHAVVSDTIVVGPSFEVTVETSNKLGQRDVTLFASDHAPQFLALTRQRLLGGLHVPVALVPSVQVAILSKTEAEEVEGGSPLAQVDDSRFLPIDFQPQPSFFSVDSGKQFQGINVGI